MGIVVETFQDDVVLCGTAGEKKNIAVLSGKFSKVKLNFLGELSAFKESVKGKEDEDESWARYSELEAQLDLDQGGKVAEAKKKVKALYDKVLCTSGS